tara:strand:- start:51 stop:743 length:693 start_codon:yes stop_codon:yes gene_type:complete
MYKKIENICIKENVKLAKLGLSEHSFGNVSIRVNNDLFFIKPSGVKVNKLKNGDCPLISIKTGKVLNKSALKPSVDTPTHLEIYKNFKNIKSISHCHSKYATSWAQASKSIPLLGTTHADFWEKDIPVVKFLKKNQMKKYELYTGKLICKKIKNEKINIYTCPGLLVSGHGQFSWGNNYLKAVINSNLIEYVAHMAYASIKIGIKKKLPKYISKFHFDRKNSKKKYYGQN